jgi:hypothetical protein
MRLYFYLFGFSTFFRKRHVIFYVNRYLGIHMSMYTVVILIGSVFLGWHYAIDGYFTILLAFVFYRFFIDGVLNKKSRHLSFDKCQPDRLSVSIVIDNLQKQ